MNFLWSIFDEENDDFFEGENFKIEELRICSCFCEEIFDFIEENNREIDFDKLYVKLHFEMQRKRGINDFYIYYSKISILCCSKLLKICPLEEELDKDVMDENCLAEKVDFHCLYFLSRETIFNCICDNCQRSLLKLISRKFIIIKLK